MALSDEAMRCECGRIKGRDKKYCFFCDPDISPQEKYRARVKGGKGSKKARPMALDDLPESINDVSDLKGYYMAIIRSTADGRISPSQCRALVGAGSALRDSLELEMYQQMLGRLDTLEDHLSQDIGAGADWELLEEPGLTDLTDESEE